MDPLSITTGVSSLLVVTARVIKALHDVHSLYQDAPLLLSSISSECSVVYAALGLLQKLQVNLSLSAQLQDSDQILSAFNVALLSCALTLSVLEKDVEACIKAGRSPNDATAIKKCKVVFERDHLQELLHQIRGQQTAMTLLLTTIQTQSVAELREAVQQGNVILQQIRNRARSLWLESEQSSTAPETIYGSGDSVWELSSMVTDTRFDFDDDLLQSATYQRALANLRHVQRENLQHETLPVHQSSSPVRVGNDTTVPDEIATLHNSEVDSLTTARDPNLRKAPLAPVETTKEPWWKKYARPRTPAPRTLGQDTLTISRKLLVVGDGAAGKSTMLIRISKGAFAEVYVPTLFENYVADVEVDGVRVELALWDISGNQDYDRLRQKHSYPGTDVVIICYEVMSPDSLENVEEKWAPEVKRYAKGVPFILVGTQTDLRDCKGWEHPSWACGSRPVGVEQGEAIARKIGAAAHLECSAKTNKGIPEVFEMAARQSLLARKGRKERKG